MANETIIPQIRFPEFIGNWAVKEFGDLYDFKFTNSFSRDNLNYENGIVKNIHYGDIHTKFNSQFDITKELVPYVNEDIDISRINDENYLIEGDLVIADASEDYADIGKSIEIVNLNNEKILAGLHTILARRKSDDIAIGFASFILKTNPIRLEVMKIAQGSKVLSISSGRLANIGLTLPKPEEQTKIANFIARVDNQIQLLEKEKTLLEKYKKGISQKIFNQEIRFKDDNGNDFPDWEEKVLGDIFYVQGGYAFKSIDFEKEGIPIIRISNLSIKNNDIDTSNLVYSLENENLKDYLIEKGKLLVALSGATTGKISVYNLDSLAYVNQRVGMFNLIDDNFDYKYLIQYAMSMNFKQQISMLLVAGAQPNISTKDIELFKIPIPSRDEQIKISSTLSNFDKLIENVDLQINKTKLFKKGLLQKMFL